MKESLKRVLSAAALAALLFAGPAAAFHSDEMRTPRPDHLDWPFVDHDGQPRTLHDYEGKVVLLFFGYVDCPNYCPTVLLNLKNAMKLLGDAAAGVQVGFVTLDPEHDDAERLKAYVTAFDPAFVGLRAAGGRIAETALAFRIYNARTDEPGGSVNIDHTLAIAVYDRTGRLRLRMPENLSPEEMAEDVRDLLRERP